MVQVLGGLPVGTDTHGLLGGQGCMGEDGVGVTGLEGVVRDAGLVHGSARRIDQRGLRPPVQHSAPHRSDGVAHGEPGELVAERHGVAVAAQHAAGHAVVDAANVVDVVDELVEQPHLDGSGHDGDGVEHLAGRLGEP